MMNEPTQDSEATRWSLLARLKDWDDSESWREFFDSYSRLIYSVATRAGLNDAEAQDVVQDTVLSVAKSIHQFHCDPAAGSFKAWLLKLTRWRILNQLKKRLPSQVGPGLARAGGGLGPGGLEEEDETRTRTVERLPDPAGMEIEAVWDREWDQNLAKIAREAVQRQVSAQQFQIFELSVIQGWPVREVARMLNVSAGQVYLARHRVRRLFQRERKRLQSRAPRTG